MATRKRAPKAKGAKRSTGKQPSRSDVLLEEIRAQNRAVIEAVLSEGQARKRDIAEFREELVVRLDVLESVAREHTRILGEHTQTLGEHSRILDEHTRILGEHTQTLGEHTQRFDRLEAKLEALPDASLEQRVAALERKSG